MAAAAARNRSPKIDEAEKKKVTVEVGDSAKMPDRQPPMSIGALAAQAARARKQREDEDVKESSNPSPQTTEQVLETSVSGKKNATKEAGDISDKVPDRQPPMSIGALAAQAARARKQTDGANESSNPSPQTTEQVVETSESRTLSGRTEGIEAIGGSMQISKEGEAITSNERSETESTRAENRPQNESSPEKTKTEEPTQIEKESNDIDKQNIQQGKTIEDLEAELNNPELNAEERKRLKRKLKKKRQKMKKST